MGANEGRKKPWLAAVIALFLPPAAMAYLNRGGWALAYFLALIAIIVGGFYFLPTMVSTDDAGEFARYAAGSLNLLGVLHAYLLARFGKANGPGKWYSRRWYLIAAGYYAFFGLLLIVRAFFYQTFNVPSASMAPTVVKGDFFVADKSVYREREPVRGDVILFRPGIFPQNIFFKRVVGLPGERIQLRGGVIFINGRPIDRANINCGSTPCDPAQYMERLSPSRSYRVQIADAGGEVENTEVFVVPANSYFVLGDNRDNSDDSRTQIGYVSSDQIIGRATYKYISGGHYVWELIQ